MSKTNSKSKKRERSESPRSFASPSPFSIASSTGSISELAEDILKDPNNLPLDTRRETMRKAVSNLKPSTVKSIYNELQNTGGKKKKRITIKKKKARKSLKKPMFKRKSAKHK
jgi:hypothetical protein